MRVLGVDSRAEAAHLLAEYEQGEDIYQGLVYQRPDIADESVPGAKASPEDGIDAKPSNEAESADKRDLADVGKAAEVPDPGGRNDLNAWQRLGLILAIAFGSALAFGAILAGLDALSRLS